MSRPTCEKCGKEIDFNDFSGVVKENGESAKYHTDCNPTLDLDGLSVSPPEDG